ncbi:MAG: hypothetical protein EXR95_10565, partial [Gemmatimonadetes bacterium]|nr:hypothetical protein [Gemmatimonadota bacterium]
MRAYTRGSGDRAGPSARALARLLPWVALVLLAVWTGHPLAWWLPGSAAVVGLTVGLGAEVTLVNERAEAFLGRIIEVGTQLADRGDPEDEVAAWVRMYFRDALRGAAAEFQLGRRRVRVRARRIDRRGTMGGAVMSVEDVTDELRAERVLALGEMARQVAHEVKNPLT